MPGACQKSQGPLLSPRAVLSVPITAVLPKVLRPRWCWAQPKKHPWGSVLQRVQRPSMVPRGAFIDCWSECKTVQPLGKTVWQFPTKLNPLLPYNPKELKIYVRQKICTQRSVAALFRMTKTCGQPRCPSVGEWVNKLCHIQIMEYCSSLKRTELSSHAKTCALNAHDSVKEANLKELHAVWFQRYEVLEKAEPGRQ